MSVHPYPALERAIARDPELLNRFTGSDAAQWRRSLRLAQDELAALLRLSRSTITRFEGGAGIVPAWYVFACAGCEPSIRRDMRDEHRRQRMRRYAAKRRRRANGLPEIRPKGEEEAAYW